VCMWVVVCARHSHAQVDVLLRDILAHVSVDRAYERLQPRLVAIVQKILAKHDDFQVGCIHEYIVVIVVCVCTHSLCHACIIARVYTGTVRNEQFPTPPGPISRRS
jgi:hypothetical protein